MPIDSYVAAVEPAGRITKDGPLKAFRSALATVATKPLDILLVADSIGEGYYASSHQAKWSQQFIKLMQAMFNPPGVRGGEGYIKTRYFGYTTASNGAPALPQRFTYSAGVPATGSDTFGLGLSGVELASGQTATFTFTGDRFSIFYTQGSGAGGVQVTIDGTVNKFDAFNAVLKTGRKWDSPALAYGNHTVVITPVNFGASTNLEVFLGGAMIYDGDFGSGVRIWDSAHYGYAASDFANTNWAQAEDNINPDLVIVALGSNDMLGAVDPTTYGNNLAVIVNAARAAATSNPSVVLVFPPYRSDAAKWNDTAYVQQCRAQLYKQAAILGCGVVDLYDIFPAPVAGGATASDIFVDGVHPTDAGHQLYARHMMRYLVGSSQPPAPPVVESNTFTAQGIVGTGLGTQAWVIEAPCVWESGRLFATTPPGAGGSVVLDVRRSSGGGAPSSIFTTTANRPTLAAGVQSQLSATPDQITFQPGDYLLVDRVTADGVAAGLTYTIRLRRTR